MLRSSPIPVSKHPQKGVFAVPRVGGRNISALRRVVDSEVQDFNELGKGGVA